MKITRLHHISAVIAALLSAPSFAAEPYLPSPGVSTLTLSYSNQKSKEFKAGAMTRPLPATLKQDTYKLNYTYGILDQLALDVEVGNGKTNAISSTTPGLKGSTDSRIGLRFRAFDDLADDPVTLTLGAAAILKGNYDPAARAAIGDGANAIEISASVAKALTSNVNAFATFGIRDRQSPVPTETFYKFGMNFSPTSFLGLSLAHEVVKSDGNLDIAGPGFSAARFPEVKEEFSFTTLGANFRVSRNFAIGMQYGEKRPERNASDSKVVGLSLTTSF